MRQAGDRTPVLMLTARDAVADRWPASTPAPTTTWSSRSRCASCWRACARCCGAGSSGAAQRLRFADLALDPAARDVWRGDRRIELTRTEYGLLELLPAPPAPGPHARADLRAGVGLRLRRRPRTRSASTWATCAARPRRAASRACCTRCAAWATCCASTMTLRRRLSSCPRLAVGRDGRARPRWSVTSPCAASCARRSITELRAQGELVAADSGALRGGGAARAAPARRAGGPSFLAGRAALTAWARDRQGGLAIGVASGDVGAAGGAGAGDPFLRRPHRPTASPPARPSPCPIEGLGARPTRPARWRASTPRFGACRSCSSCSCGGHHFAAAHDGPVRAAGGPAGRSGSRMRPSASRATGDLGRRIGARGEDGSGRGAALRRHAGSRVGGVEQEAQRRPGGASHELRTPVTALRTTWRTCSRGPSSSEGEQRTLLRDMVEQSEELERKPSAISSSSPKATSGDPPIEDVALDEVVGEAVRRAERHAGAPPSASSSCLGDRRARRTGRPRDGQRAAQRGRVQPAGRRGRGAAARRRAGGPRPRAGCAEDELVQLFDHFFRGAHGRARPGSGLGLAIVRQVAEAHGATVSAANAPGGGLVVRLAFAPVRRPSHCVAVRVA